MSFQLNLFDEGIAEVYVIAKALQHKRKIYKKCGMKNCINEIANKPSRHYCWLHIMENYEKSIPLFEIKLINQV